MDIFISNLIDIAIQDNVKKLSVGAVILYENRILILKRCPDDFMPNIYELPGGGLEKGESLFDALERELIEETNFSINKVIGYIDHIDFSSYNGLLTRRFNFIVEPKLPLVIKLTEHVDHRWILPIESDQYEITTQTKKIIRNVYDDNIHYFKYS